MRKLKTWLLLCLLAGTCQLTLAQQSVITGRVLNAANDTPLAGVTVSSGSKTTITGADGSFTISVPAGSALKFSYVGFTDRTVAAAANLRIRLEPANGNLDAVVVMGYSTKTAKSVTGVATVVSETKLKDVTASSVDKMLQGKVAGVFVGNSSGNPNAQPSIRIRGIGTLTADNSPLYVVDGIIGEMPNPSDVESVTVLKDAAATTLYGARAANGVIVITTKKGRTGAPKFTARASYGIANVNLGHFKLMQGKEYYDLQYNYYKQTYTGNDFNSYIETVLPSAMLQHNTNWVDQAFTTAHITDAQLTVAGGSEKNRYYLSGNYYSEEGILNLTGLKRGSIRFNSDYNLTKKFNLTFNSAVRYTKSIDNSNGSAYQAYTNLPWDAAYDAAGRPVDPRVSDWYGRDQTNFLYDQQYNKYGYNTFDGDMLIKGEYVINNHWSISSTNRLTGDYQRAETLTDAKTAGGADYNGLLENYSEFQYSYITSNLLKFKQRIGERHEIDALAGQEYQNNYFESSDAQGTGIAPNITILDATSNALKVGGTKYSSAFSSLFFQGSYNLDRKYYFTTSFRRDGSSRFGANKKYGNFFAFGGAWLISDEAFFKKNPVVNRLKLRASYGTTGNANLNGDYKAYGKYNATGSYNGQPGAYPSVVDAPNLSWEKAYTLNLGLDVSLFRDRININFDIYNRNNKNLLFDVPLPGTAGYSYVTQNVGTVNNKGIELSISSVNIRGKNFEWSTDFNISFNKNRITALYGGVTEINDPAGRFRFVVGQDVRSFYMRKWAGVDPANGDPLWEITNANGTKGTTNVYNNATLQTVGTASPNYMGSIRNTFVYKNIDLMGFFTFMQGNLVYNGNRELFDNDGAYNRYNMMELDKGWSRWQKPGDQATHPLYVVGGNRNAQKTSSRFLENGSYLRLRSLSLGYNFPKRTLAALKLDNIRLSVSAENLFTLTHFSGIDPEADDRGEIGTKYPYARRVLFGLQVNF